MKTKLAKGAKNIIKSTKQYCKKNGSYIAIGAGMVGYISACVLTAYGTVHAVRIYDDLKEEYEEEEIPKKEIVLSCWKCYAPAVLTAFLSTACVTSGAVKEHSKNAALVSALEVSRNIFTEYKNKVVETVGENKEKKIKEEIAQDHIKEQEAKGNTVIMVSEEKQWFRIKYSNTAFKATMKEIDLAFIEINYRMIAHDSASLNELYLELNIDPTDEGNRVGWNVMRGKLEYTLNSYINKDGLAVIDIKFSEEPYADYDI